LLVPARSRRELLQLLFQPRQQRGHFILSQGIRFETFLARLSSSLRASTYSPSDLAINAFSRASTRADASLFIAAIVFGIL
jgi:hypothetical protein